MSRPKVRAITTVWGESYLSDFAKLALPAVMAPGNLPALAAATDFEFALVTERRLFPVVEAMPLFKRLRATCRALLIPNDDLVISRQMYGMSLTYSLHRGFEDLGDRMTEHYLVFFNSDFILADGSWRSLVPRIADGQRLMFSPSYCAVTEEVTPQLLERIDPARGILSVAPRDVAHMILDHRHDCIRAKTVNRQTFHMNISDQFYWHVDDRTLLGHQLPISLVCMRPERVHLEPLSFWDYATISGACPTTPRDVIGDSDEFLILELRSRSTYSELMLPGPADLGEVAAGLGGYMTADQFEMGRYPLTLHADDLPAGVEEARSSLKAHVDDIYARLPSEPKSHIDHQYWRHSIDEFRRLRDAWQAREGAGGTAIPPAGSRGRLRRAFRWVYDTLLGRLPDVTMVHPMWSLYRSVAGAALPHVRKADCRMVVVESAPGVLGRLAAKAPNPANFISSSSLLRFNMPQDARDVTLCLCELSWADYARFPEMYGFIRQRMVRGGRVIAHVVDDRLATLRADDFGQITVGVPRTDSTQLRLAGSIPSARLVGVFRQFMTALDRLGRWRTPFILAALVVLAPLAIVINALERRRRSSRMPGICTAITLEIEVT